MSRSHIFSRGAAKLHEMVRGEGVYLWSKEGERFLDGSAGPICVNIGHGVKEVADAVYAQMKQVSYVHSSHLSTTSVIDCARKVAEFAPSNFNQVFFCSGGSLATEAAAKMARQYFLQTGEPKRFKIIARWQSYHGNTLGALSMSGNIGRRRRYVPMLLDVPHIPPAYCYRCPYSKTRDNCDLDCARALETQIRSDGPEYVAAFIAEPYVGATLGALPAAPGYFQLIREICDEHGVLFIVDEVMTGFGRTGKKWGLDHWDTLPDIIATAKGMSGGYLPLGATIASDKVFEGFAEPFAHGHTYGSHPVACAAGVAVLDYMNKHNLIEKSRVNGEYLHKKLESFYDHPSVGDIRGSGLFSGIEFVKDKETKEPFASETRFNARVVSKCFDNGLLVYPGTGTIDGVRGDHIIVAPPLVASKGEVDEIIELLDKSLTEVEKES